MYTMSSSAEPLEASAPVSYWSGYEVLWGLRPPSRRTALDRRQIVDAAIALADREGLAAVTMRRLARALHTAPMSLYRHVPDKDALVAMMIDRAIETRGTPHDARPGGWRAGLMHVASSTWHLCQVHRWFPEATLARPPITPSGIAGFEYALSLFDGLDLDVGTCARFVSTVFATVVSSALSAFMSEAARSHTRLSAEELFAEGAPVMARIVASGEFPRVAAFLCGAEHLDAEAQMRASVALILDGIAARLALEASTARSATAPS